MSRHIEENALINELHHHFVDGFIEDKWWNSTHVMYAITHTPTADVVKVVRCGECKHLMSDGRCFEFADDEIRPSASDYCSYGERREDEQIH